MGQIRIPIPAQVVIGVIHTSEAILCAAEEKLSQALGPIRRVGQQMDFIWTDYYNREMGDDLKRCFLLAEDLCPRERLADIKLLTNEIEQQLADADGRRRINLDPGLLSLENFILATTKNHPHRIYLRDGIFAEVTLWFVRGAFETFEWTYPDYRSEEICQLLTAIREEYKSNVKKMK